MAGCDEVREGHTDPESRNRKVSAMCAGLGFSVR